MCVTDLLATLERTPGGTYTFEREIVGGSMSRVFLAMDRNLGREIIIKVLSADVAADLCDLLRCAANSLLTALTPPRSATLIFEDPFI